MDIESGLFIIVRSYYPYPISKRRLIHTFYSYISLNFMTFVGIFPLWEMEIDASFCSRPNYHLIIPIDVLCKDIGSK